MVLQTMLIAHSNSSNPKYYARIYRALRNGYVQGVLVRWRRWLHTGWAFLYACGHSNHQWEDADGRWQWVGAEPHVRYGGPWTALFLARNEQAQIIDMAWPRNSGWRARDISSTICSLWSLGRAKHCREITECCWALIAPHLSLTIIQTVLSQYLGCFFLRAESCLAKELLFPVPMSSSAKERHIWSDTCISKRETRQQSEKLLFQYSDVFHFWSKLWGQCSPEDLVRFASL